MKKINFYLLFLSVCCSCLTAFLPALPAFAQSAKQEKINRRPRFIMPVQYYILAEGKRSDFLFRYCRATNIPLKHKKKTWKAGPFLSTYEAGWLASRIPHACVEKQMLFSPSKEPISTGTLAEILGEEYKLEDAKVLETGFLKIGKETLLRIYLEFQDKKKYESLFLEKQGRLLRVVEWPWMDDPYQQSFGTGIVTIGGSLIFLTIENALNGVETKTENLRAWRFDAAGEKIDLKLFESFTEFACIWDIKHRGYIDFQCSRISLLRNAIRLRHFNSHMISVGFDPDQTFKSATSWQIKGPDKDALKIKRMHWPVKETWKWDALNL